MLNKITIIICAFLIFGCSVGPDYHRPELYNNQQLAENLDLDITKGSVYPRKTWYDTLKDENLNQLITDALNNAPDLITAHEKLQQARINLGLAKAAWGPEISATGNYNQSKAFENTDYRSKTSYYQSGFDATWEIDIWGGIRRLNENKKAMMHAAESDFENVKAVLIAEIAANYINYRKNEKLLQITEQNIKLQQDIFDIVKKKYSAGLSDDLSLQQALSAVLSTKMQIPPLQTAVNLYKNNMALLSGKLIKQLKLSNSNIMTEKRNISLADLYNLPVDIVRNRPDVRTAEQNLIAQNALIGNRIAALFPSVSLSGLLGWQNTTLSPLISSDYQIYNWTGAVDLPLIDWKKRINQINLQKSVTNQALMTYQKSILSAVSDINQAMKNLTESTRKLENSSKNQDTQRKILKLSWKKYKNGVINFSEVLTAEQNKLTAEQQYINDLSDWYLNYISFNKSIGGGFAVNHPLLHDDRTDVADGYDELDKD